MALTVIGGDWNHTSLEEDRVQLDPLRWTGDARSAEEAHFHEHLAEPYRAAARAALERVAARAELSAATREIVSKALQG